MKNKLHDRYIHIDDLFLFWFAHWRSFIITLVTGIVVSCLFFFISVTHMDNEVDSSAAVTLSPSELLAVDEAEKLHSEYEEALILYDLNKEAIDAVARAEAVHSFVQSKVAMESLLSGYFNDRQRAEYYNRLRIPTPSTDSSITTKSKSVPVIKSILIVLLFVIFHGIVVSYIYVSDKTIRHADILSADAYTHKFLIMVDWDRINITNTLDSFITKKRMKNIKCISFADSLKINIRDTLYLIRQKKLSCLMLIECGSNDKALTIKKMLEETSTAGDNLPKIICVDSFKYNVNCQDSFSNTDSAILIAEVAKTQYDELYEEWDALNNKNIEMLGLYVFE